MTGLLQDLRYAVRQFGKVPGLAAVVVITIALGIGANTALFSVVNGVLLNPLPYPHPEQLVALRESKANFEFGTIPYLTFRDWQKNNRTFTSMAVWRGNAFSLTGTGEAEQVFGEFISSDFFPILGTKPLLGRTLAMGEDEIGAAPIALISEGLWRRKFEAERDIVGKGITLDGKSYAIVGVIPASLHFFSAGSTVREVFVPIGQWTNNLLTSRSAGLGINGIGRLKPGVTIEQARADMDLDERQMPAAFYPHSQHLGYRYYFIARYAGNKEVISRAITQIVSAVDPNLPVGDFITLAQVVDDSVLNHRLVAQLSTFFGLLAVLLASIGIYGLMSYGVTRRTNEFGVRLALGAARRHVIWLVLRETTRLVATGLLIGLIAMPLISRFVVSFLFGLKPYDAVSIASAVFTLTTVALLAGYLPARRASQVDPMVALRYE